MPTGGIFIDTRFKGKFSAESIKVETNKLVENLEENGVFFDFKNKTIGIKDKKNKKSKYHTFINFSSDPWVYETFNAQVSYDNITKSFNYQEKDRKNNPPCILSDNSIPAIIYEMKKYFSFINYFNNLNNYITPDTKDYLDKIEDWKSFFSNEHNAFFAPREQALIFEFYKELSDKTPEDITKMALKNLEIDSGKNVSCKIGDHFIIMKHSANNKYYLEHDNLSDHYLYNSFVFSDSYNNDNSKINLKFKISDVLCNEPAIHLSPLNKICSNVSSVIPVLEQYFSLMSKLGIKNKNAISINKETLDLYILRTDDYSYKNLYKYLPDSSDDLPLIKIKNGAKNV